MDGFGHLGEIGSYERKTTLMIFTHNFSPRSRNVDVTVVATNVEVTSEVDVVVIAAVSVIFVINAAVAVLISISIGDL